MRGKGAANMGARSVTRTSSSALWRGGLTTMERRIRARVWEIFAGDCVQNTGMITKIRWEGASRKNESGCTDTLRGTVGDGLFYGLSGCLRPCTTKRKRRTRVHDLGPKRNALKSWVVLHQVAFGYIQTTVWGLASREDRLRKELSKQAKLGTEEALEARCFFQSCCRIIAMYWAITWRR